MARNAMLLNQLGTPGLGSLMAGRWLAGSGQLLLSVAGFGFVLSWFGLVLHGLYREFQEDATPKPMGWVGLIGAGFFGVAWLWALVTSLSLLKEAAPEAAPPPKL